MFSSIQSTFLTHCLYLVLNTQETIHFYWQWFHILKNELKLTEKREKDPTRPFRVTCWLARLIQPKRLVRPGQLAANSERACGIFFSLLILIYFFEHETIGSRNDLSLRYSERDTSSVTPEAVKLSERIFFWLFLHCARIECTFNIQYPEGKCRVVSNSIPGFFRSKSADGHRWAKKIWNEFGSHRKSVEWRIIRKVRIEFISLFFDREHEFLAV